ncbi:MAG: hypothetical protein EBU33_00500 [Sphingobacteriia bacterium]|jgi:hypothetical protein|nr:hypothetical protein [Sphingobacteriia bacterium]
MMSKPWVGILAASLMFIAGILEVIGRETALGIFLMLMSVISFFVRAHFIKKLRGGDTTQPKS